MWMPEGASWYMTKSETNAKNKIIYMDDDGNEVYTYIQPDDNITTVTEMEDGRVSVVTSVNIDDLMMSARRAYEQ